MNSILMTTYMAGTILSQATFGNMTECASARDVVLQQNSKDISVVCSYSSNASENFGSFFKDFKNMIKELQDKMQKDDTADWTPFNDFEGSARCGSLAVEPNKWISKDKSNPSSPYEPLCR